MKTFFDANVLLEILLPERPKLAAAKVAVQSASKRCISPLTAHLYVRFGKKQGFALNELLAAVSRFELTDMGKAQVRWAIRNCQDNDFEDALQVACAVLYGCETFVTLDKPLAEKYRQFIDMRVL